MNRSEAMRGWGRLALGSVLCAVAVVGASVSCRMAAAQNAEAAGTGAPTAAHTVVLIAVSGLRWDGLERAPAPHLLAIAKRGVWAPQGMLPAFPAEEAPNLFSIATGLYPGHHGIVADSFEDPQRGETYSAADAKRAAESAWYGGTPLWSLAEKNGIKTACIGWTGCEAEIAGARPTYHAAREGAEGAVRQALTWLRLPAEQRPRLIAIVLDEVGKEARAFGPDAAQTGAAVRGFDAAMGRLDAELRSTGQPVDLVIVSDRGFAKPEGGWINLEQLAPLHAFHSEGLLLYTKQESDRARAYTLLKKASSEFFSYRLKDLPADLHMNANPRLGDPVVVATGPYALRVSAASAAAEPSGLDGFDPRVVPEMKAVFLAAGPDLVAGKTVEPFGNVNLYPWLAHLLGLSVPKNEGSLNILSGTLRDNGGPEN